MREKSERCCRKRKELLAIGEPIAELPGREIHQLDLVGRLDRGVRHGFAHGHAGNLAHGVRTYRIRRRRLGMADAEGLRGNDA